MGTWSLSFFLTLLLSESHTALRQLGSDVTTSLSAQLPTLDIVSRWGLIDVAILHSEFLLSEQNQDATSYNAVFVNTKPPAHSLVVTRGGLNFTGENGKGHTN